MQGAKSLTLVWAIAFAMAVATILLLLNFTSKMNLPKPPEAALDVDIVVGSSFSEYLLPTYERLPSLSNIDRDTQVISVSGATASETLKMLTWAINHTQGDVFVEVNAMTLQFKHLPITSFPWLTPFLEAQVAVVTRLKATIRRFRGLSSKGTSRKAKLGRSSNQSLENNRLPTRTISYTPQGFLYSRQLREKIDQLADAQRSLILIWPPVPEGGAGADFASWHRARDHVDLFCRRYAVECWLPNEPWPNHFFVDFWGHLGPMGRERFAAIFSDWLLKNR